MRPAYLPAALSFALLLSLPGTNQARRPRPPCPHRKCSCRGPPGKIIVRCPAVAGEVPPFKPMNITYDSLELIDRNISVVKEGAFMDSPTKRLDLAQNWLGGGNLDPGAFSGLEDILVFLSLQACRLTEVPTICLKNLTLLETLHLDSNYITVLEKKAFRGNRNLRELFLHRNKIERIESSALSGLANLETLKLFENNLASLPRRLFRGIGNLTDLDLSNNRLRRLGSGVFRGLDRLMWLELGSNLLTSLKKNVFNGLKKLKYLKLDNNPFTKIGPGSFTRLPRLEYLSLDTGNVTNLSNLTFRGLSRLRTLMLGEVNRPTFPPGLLSASKKLKHLSAFDSLNKFNGFTPGMFSKNIKFSKLEIWTAPFYNCTCKLPWVKAMTDKGAYVRGTCAHPTNQQSNMRCIKMRKLRRKGRGKGNGPFGEK